MLLSLYITFFIIRYQTIVRVVWYNNYDQTNNLYVSSVQKEYGIFYAFRAHFGLNRGNKTYRNFVTDEAKIEMYSLLRSTKVAN